jgi:uncharacterized protein
VTSRAAVVLASILLLGAAPPVLEKPAKYATDKAGVIPGPRLDALNEELAHFERETSNQIVVYVDRRLPADTTLEELANVTYRSWGIGQKDRSNGVLFLVFVDDRAMRIEVGYGLEGVVTDAKAKRITNDVVKPLFRKGDYAGGVEAGARALMRTARSEGYAGTGRTVAETGRPAAAFEPWALGATFAGGFVPLVLGFARRRRTGARIPGILAWACAGGAIASFVCAAVTHHVFFWVLGAILLMATIVLGIVNAVAAAIGRAGAAGGRSSSGDDSWRSSSSSSSASTDSYSSSSDSSSSSDFSGGGGDSGGGGSSDNW